MSGLVNVPSEAEIRQIVSQVVTDRRKPLDEVITRVIWDGDPAPLTWGGWNQEARDVWSLACKIFYEETKARRPWKKGSRNTLSLERSWEVILEFAPDPFLWWVIPGVTWKRIGDRIRVSPRTAAYRMNTLGWKLVGSGMRVPSREVVLAPCVECGRVWRPPEISDRMGSCCEEEHGLE